LIFRLLPADGEHLSLEVAVGLAIASALASLSRLRQADATRAM